MIAVLKIAHSKEEGQRYIVAQPSAIRGNKHTADIQQS